jgi:predicted acyl esterase
MLKMRDGVKLHTVITMPHGFRDGDKKFPAVMDRSPYGYSDMEWIPDIFLPFGFVAVGQDIRGTEKSMGNYTMWVEDDKDSRDLGDWITSQPWSNGEVYTIGASADGIASFQTPKTSPPWLKAAYTIWSPDQLYDILFPKGAFKQKTAEDWIHGLNMPSDPWRADQCVKILHEEENGYGELWKAIGLDDDFYKNKVTFPSGFYAGWYDLFLQGTTNAYLGYNFKSQPQYQQQSRFLIDPCGHCIEAQPFFPQNTVEGRTGLVLAQLLETFGIRPMTRDYQVKNVTFYVMSSNDDAGNKAANYWTSMEEFPVPQKIDYFLNADKTSSKSQSGGAESTTYTHNPTDPIPTLGGNNLPSSIGGSIPCGPMDQSPIDGRADMLLFETATLKEGEELTLGGEIWATLYVSSDAKDTDFMVRVEDVYHDANNTARIITDNAVRMRWRNQAPEPEYLESGKVYKVEMPLGITAFSLAVGHSLRFSVQSSNFPRFSVNYNNGMLLKDPNYPGEAIVAKNTLYHSEQYPSKITLPITSKKVLPKVHVLKEVKGAFKHITDDVVEKATKWLEKAAGKL